MEEVVKMVLSFAVALSPLLLINLYRDDYFFVDDLNLFTL